jgi:hypothetical protein
MERMIVRRSDGQGWPPPAPCRPVLRSRLLNSGVSGRSGVPRRSGQTIGVEVSRFRRTGDGRKARRDRRGRAEASAGRGAARTRQGNRGCSLVQAIVPISLAVALHMAPQLGVVHGGSVRPFGIVRWLFLMLAHATAPPCRNPRSGGWRRRARLDMRIALRSGTSSRPAGRVERWNHGWRRNRNGFEGVTTPGGMWRAKAGDRRSAGRRPGQAKAACCPSVSHASRA